MNDCTVGRCSCYSHLDYTYEICYGVVMACCVASGCLVELAWLIQAALIDNKYCQCICKCKRHMGTTTDTCPSLSDLSAKQAESDAIEVKE